MALGVLLSRGIESALADGWAQFTQTHGPPARVQEIPAVLRRMPAVLDRMGETALDDEAPVAARALLPTVLTYLLRHDDEIPADENQLIFGILDDAYVVLRAAAELDAALGNPTVPSLHRDLGTLRQALPRSVVDTLDTMVDDVLTGLIAASEREG